MNENSGYLKQPDIYSCGPTAICNALIWGGFSVDKSVYDQVVDLCNVFPIYEDRKFYGTYRQAFDHALSKTLKEKLKILKRRDMDYEDVIKILDSGKSIIILYAWDTEESYGAHYCFMYKEKKQYKVVNLYRKGEPVRTLKKRVLKYMLHKSNDRFYSYPYLWIINKSWQISCMLIIL